MKTDLTHDEWRGRTGGLPWMQRTLIVLLAHVDQRIIYGVMACVVPFYMIFSPRGYRAQYRLFRERMGLSWWRAFGRVYLNHFRFGQIIVDRFAAYGGRKFRFEIENYDLWLQHAQREEGFIQLSAHMGNYELAGYSLCAEHKRIHALVFMGETATVVANRHRFFTPNNIEMVPMMPDMSHIFMLNNALSDGQIVSMAGDRIFGSQKSLTCDFLGARTQWPLGPFSLAVTRGCAVLAVFVMKKDWQTYQILIRPLTADSDVSGACGRRDRLKAAQRLAERFVSEVEQTLREYPTQWFNYYDFFRLDP